MPTPTLYKFIASELHQMTGNEIVDDDGNLVFFDREHQIMPKILRFDDDVYNIMNQLFNGLQLEQDAYDYHFKRAFLYRFINRKINRQTIEAFQFQLMSTFLTSESYINRVYRDAEKFIVQYTENEATSRELSSELSKQISEQITEQLDKRESEDRNRQDNRQTSNTDSNETSRQTSGQRSDGETETSNRQARATLPQNRVNVDLNDDTMRSANENEISKSVNNEKRNSATDTDNDLHSESSNITEGESSGETSATSTGNTNTETRGETDTERDTTRDGENEGKSIAYRLDELFKSSGMMEGIFNTFDRKCFLQTW